MPIQYAYNTSSDIMNIDELTRINNDYLTLERTRLLIGNNFISGKSPQ